MYIVLGYEYLNSGQARACKYGLIRFSLNWSDTCKRGLINHVQVSMTTFPLFNTLELHLW